MSKVLQAVKNLIPMMLVTGAVITGSSRAQALSAYDLKCIAAMPTTTLLLVDAGETVQGQLIHHNGVEYMPIHSGVIVPNDLPILGRWATELKSLGPQQRFSFPKSKCTEHGGKVMKCIDEKAGGAPHCVHVGMRTLLRALLSVAPGCLRLVTRRPGRDYTPAINAS